MSLSRLQSKFEVRIVGEECREEILELIKDHYSEDFGRMFGMTKTEAIDLAMFRANFIIKQGMVLGVFEKATKRLVACVLHGVGKNALRPDISDLTNGKFHATQAMLSWRKMLGQVFEGLPEKLHFDIIHSTLGTVHRDFRGIGLLHHFIAQDYMDLIKKSGCKYIVSFTMNSKMWDRSLKGGFVLWKEINFSEYVDPLTGLKPYEHLQQPPFTHVRSAYRDTADYYLINDQNHQPKL